MGDDNNQFYIDNNQSSNTEFHPSIQPVEEIQLTPEERFRQQMESEEKYVQSVPQNHMPVQQEYNKPVQAQQEYNEPVQAQQEYNKPVQAQQEYNEPVQAQQGYNEQIQVQQEYNEPIQTQNYNENAYQNTTVEERQRERFVSKSTSVAAKYLRRMIDLKGAPNNLKYFTDILENTYIKLMDVNKPAKVKTIGTFCVMVPPELVYAAGAIPVKLCCGSYTAYNIGDELSPRDACPLVKAVVGAQAIHSIPVYENCDLMVVPTTCDCKKKMAYLMEEYKPTMALHIPSSKKDDEDLDYFVEDLYNLRVTLEDLTGNKITYRKLLKSIKMISEVQYEISRFVEFKKSNPSLIKGTHAMAIMNSVSYDHIERWGHALRLLNDELEMNLKNQNFVGRSKQPRIMITGSPVIFPNIKVPLLIEEMGGIVVADETCMGERGMYDPVALVDMSFDGLMRSLAKRYILPCSCPTFVNNEQRIFKIKQMIDDNEVEGVIYHVLRGCLVYDYEYAMLEEELAKYGIPIIRLESDYNEEDIEQLRIRIEAFIEMIKFGKLKQEKENQGGEQYYG